MVTGSWAVTELYPSCTGNLTGLPNFSYAKAANSGPANFSCNSVSTTYTIAPITYTWYYYDTYPIPAPCGNPNLPDGDQCCHSTATSTVSWSSSVLTTVLGISQIEVFGTVTAGEFLGKSVTKTLTRGVGLNLNCDTAYGQEANFALAEVIFANGPTCLNGMQLAEYCPGSTF